MNHDHAGPSTTFKFFFFFLFNQRYSLPIAMTNHFIPRAPLKDKGLVKNCSSFRRVKDGTPNQLVKGRSELPLRHNSLATTFKL